MISSIYRNKNLFLILYFCAPDFQQRACHVGNEVLVEMDDMDNYSAPRRLPKEDIDFNSNCEINNSKVVYHTKIGNLVEGFEQRQ